MASTPKLQVWQYQVTAAGQSDLHGKHRRRRSLQARGTTATIPVVIIPRRLQFPTAAFDPTPPDNGILGVGNTAVSLTQQSNQFTPTTHVINGVNVGSGTFADAFQRAEFWPALQNSPAYHLAFNATVAPKVTVSIPKNPAIGSIITLPPGSSSSTNPANVDNPANLRNCRLRSGLSFRTGYQKHWDPLA